MDDLEIKIAITYRIPRNNLTLNGLLRGLECDRDEIVAPEASGEAIFSGFTLKWPSAFKMDKMVTRGRLSVHPQKAPQLSKEWGEGKVIVQCSDYRGGCVPRLPRPIRWIQNLLEFRQILYSAQTGDKSVPS